MLIWCGCWHKDASETSICKWHSIFLRWPDWYKELTCQYRRHKRHVFDPWVGKIPWRAEWQPTPVSLPRESHRRRSLVGYSPWARRVGHNLAIARTLPASWQIHTRDTLQDRDHALQSVPFLSSQSAPRCAIIFSWVAPLTLIWTPAVYSWTTKGVSSVKHSFTSELPLDGTALPYLYFQGRGNLLWCGPWHRKDLDTTERQNSKDLYFVPGKRQLQPFFHDICFVHFHWIWKRGSEMEGLRLSWAENLSCPVLV